MSTTARPTAATAALDGMGPAAFTILATTATVMGFVFLPPAGALLALGALWFGAESVWQRDGRPATASLMVFGGTASVLGFVFLPPAGALIAAGSLWLALGRPLPDWPGKTSAPTQRRPTSAKGQALRMRSGFIERRPSSCSSRGPNRSVNHSGSAPTFQRGSNGSSAVPGRRARTSSTVWRAPA